MNGIGISGTIPPSLGSLQLLKQLCVRVVMAPLLVKTVNGCRVHVVSSNSLLLVFAPMIFLIGLIGWTDSCTTWTTSEVLFLLHLGRCQSSTTCKLTLTNSKFYGLVCSFCAEWLVSVVAAVAGVWGGGDGVAVPLHRSHPQLREIPVLVGQTTPPP